MLKLAQLNKLNIFYFHFHNSLNISVINFKKQDLNANANYQNACPGRICYYGSVVTV